MLRVFLLCSLFAIVCLNHAHAEWVHDGTLVGGGGSSNASAMVSDGAGGAIIVWSELQNGSYDVLAGRIDASGNPLWTAPGVAVCTAAGEQTNIAAVSDGAGGAIIVWRDARSGEEDIYAQRVNSTGAATWTANGVAICTATNVQAAPLLASDGASGAIITWQDLRSGTNWDIYARRVNASGTPLWAADGVAVCTLPSGQTGAQAVADGSGGVIIGWSDYRSANGDLYAQRLNASGVTLWTANGLSVCAATGDQGVFSATTDGAGGALFAWDDERNGVRDIFAQHINGSGSPLWEVDGEVVCSAAEQQGSPEVIGDGSGGAIVAWLDFRNSIDVNIYAQRLNDAGVPMWTYDGVALCMAPEHQDQIRLVTDGASGAIAVWYDPRTGTETDVYARRVNANGFALWDYDGTPVCTAAAAQAEIRAVSDGAGGVIAAWSDYRSAASLIYAQRAEPRYGYWGRPEPTIGSAIDNPSDQGGKVIVRWTASQLDRFNTAGISHYSLWRATDVAAFKRASSVPASDATISDPRVITRAFAGAAVWKEITASGPEYWEWVGNLDATYQSKYSYTAPTRQDSTVVNPATTYFKVLAHEQPYTQSRVWESGSASARSVDNLAPAAPLLLTIQQAGGNAVLNWKPIDDADLAHYTLYRAGASGVQVIPINELTDATLPNYTDIGAAAGGYFYVVTANDIHGNRSAPSNEVSLSASTGGGGTPPIMALTALQNSPNPFSTSAEFSLGLPRDAEVTMEIFDVAGRMVSSRSIGVMEKGWRKVSLDARDDAGSPLASGVYFYRVKAAGETTTRKMVIAR